MKSAHVKRRHKNRLEKSVARFIKLSQLNVRLFAVVFTLSATTNRNYDNACFQFIHNNLIDKEVEYLIGFSPIATKQNFVVFKPTAIYAE